MVVGVAYYYPMVHPTDRNIRYLIGKTQISDGFRSNEVWRGHGPLAMECINVSCKARNRLHGAGRAASRGPATRRVSRWASGQER